MTTMFLQAAPFVETIALNLQSAYERFLHTIDAFAAARMRKAVPERQLRKAGREIDRYRRIMHDRMNPAVKRTQVQG